MTILVLNRKQLEEKIGIIDEKMQDRISMFGTPVEKIDKNEISIEIFPNRPDLLSFVGFVRALLAFLNINPGLKNYKVNAPLENYKVIIDKSVKSVRPFINCAIVKNLKFNKKKIKEIIDIQEKLHGSYGRNRKKLAIGIYPMENINLPIKFLGKKPEEIKFKPLGFPKVINGRQILNQHPAGREYGNLLKGFDVFPIFEDNTGEILSLAPIINSEITGKINEQTTEVFIECSGFNQEFLDKTLNMIVCAMADMDGEIYAMEIIDKNKIISPKLDPEKMPFSIEYINKNLGLALTEKQIKNYLALMNIGYESGGIALIPPYRTDILHEIDLCEEVAIAYGYENFEAEIPNISTIGEEEDITILKRKITEILIGLGLLEVSSYHLSTKETQFKKIGIKDFNKNNQLIEVINSKNKNNILRTSLLANNIKILSENSDAQYPQKNFEVGLVFANSEKTDTQIGEIEKLCISLCYDKANFTEIKQVLDFLMRMLNLKYEIREVENVSFINGRCGNVIVDGVEVGVIGEIGLSILKNNKIKMPVASMEIELEVLMGFMG